MRAVARPIVASCVRVDTDEPVLSLTFDDGPDPVYTEGVLDALRAGNARATFFVLGEAARAHPALVRRAVAEGHEIALHSSSHRAMTDLSVPARVRALVRGRRAVTEVAGQRPRWFRAPYGKQTPDVVVAARLLGMRPVMWSAYACEWEDERTLASCVAHASPGITRGSIVLLHDGAAGENGRSPRPAGEVVQLLEDLLDLARARGLEVVPVGELLRRGRARDRFWFRSWRVDA